MMKKWAIPLAAAAIAIVAVAGFAFALTDSGDDGDDGSRVSRDAARRADSGEDSGAADCANPPCDDVGDLAICIEGSVDCDDTVEEPADDVCIQIFPTPPECADPDESVGSEPPIVNDPPPDSCNLGASAADCENAACSTGDGGSRAPPR